ncbi:MAG: hypothetical protein AAF411_29400 [Myxococcota bacterium]
MKRSILFLVLTVAGACSSSETTRPVDAAPGEDAAIDTTTQDMDVPDAAGDADALDLAMDGAPDVRIDFTVMPPRTAGWTQPSTVGWTLTSTAPWTPARGTLV